MSLPDMLSSTLALGCFPQRVMAFTVPMASKPNFITTAFASSFNILNDLTTPRVRAGLQQEFYCTLTV